MSAVLYTAGGLVFVLLGLLHGAYTLADLRRPRRLVPRDPAVLAAMQGTGVRLAGDATTMWRAWIGFNLSHSLGAVAIGGAIVAAGLAGMPASALRWLPAAVAAIYLTIGWRCWFKVPNGGIALALGCFVIAASLP